MPKPPPGSKNPPRCGAKSKRSGNPCRGWAMPNGRCRMHGGASTGARTEAGKARIRAAVVAANTTHGIYASALRADERELWSAISVGSLDDEIRLARLQLTRALRARAAEEDALAVAAPGPPRKVETEDDDGEPEEADGAMSLGDLLADFSGLDEVSHEQGYNVKGPVDLVRRVRRKVDWDSKIDKLLARVAGLEGKQRELEKADREAKASGSGLTDPRSEERRESDRRAVQRLLREITGRRPDAGRADPEGEDAG